MKNKKILGILAIAAVFSVAATGCFGDSEPEQVVVEETPTPEPTATPTPEPTIAPDVQDTTYTSSNGNVSIKLPDATWANKTDEEDIISFESPKQGRIMILHGAGEEDMAAAVIPDTEDLAVSLEQANDMEQGTDFEIQSFNAENTAGVNVYSYTVHYKDTEKSGGFEYVVNKYFASDSEFYSIAGSAVDTSSLVAVTAAVESFRMGSGSSLSAAAPSEEAANEAGQGTDASGETTAEGKDPTDSTASSEYHDGYTDAQLADNSQTRTLYRNSDGHPLVVVPDGNGNWVDKEGNTYRFVNNEDVYDQNDVDYYWHGEAGDVRYMPIER